MLKDLFKKTSRTSVTGGDAPNVPDGLFQKCVNCNETLYTEDLVNGYYICPICGYYERINPRERLSMILDSESFVEWNNDLETDDPIDFPEYKEKIERARSATNIDEAVITGTGVIHGDKVAIDRKSVV